MSTICAQSIKLSGLAENLEVLYYKIKEVVLINQDSYHTLFDSIQDVEDWGSEWVILHTKEYEIGHSMMRIDCDSEWEPADGFWKKISKDFDVVIEIEYANPDLEYFYSTFYSDGKLLKSERITYLEHLYFTDYKKAHTNTTLINPNAVNKTFNNSVIVYLKREMIYHLSFL